MSGEAEPGINRWEACVIKSSTRHNNQRQKHEGDEKYDVSADCEMAKSI